MTADSRVTTRRQFLRHSTSATAGVALGLNLLGTPALHAVRGANEKIRVGFIGVGNRGSQLLQGFMAQDDVDIVALCDVYEPYLDRDYSQVGKAVIDSIGERVPKMGEKFAGEVARYKDFRRLLERKDIDAVVIATPDHWHAIQMIAGLPGGQGRLRGKAPVRDHSRGPQDGRGRRQVQPRRPGRPAPPVVR